MDSVQRGYVLWQGRSRIDGKPIVAIATMRTSNRKTGRMVQVWILRRDINPVLAVETGDDASVCGRCRFRKHNAGGCYVNVGQAPNAVFKAFKAGRYPFLSSAHYSQVFSGRKVRLGAYGDPMAVPANVWRGILRYASGHTSYTHQWSYMPGAAEYKAFTVASCDSADMYHQARLGGWSTFRVRRDGDALLAGEKPCPAESGKVQCIDCPSQRNCSGSSTRQVFTAITVHGVMASRF